MGLGGKMAKILVVDDSAVMRMLIKKSLREAGLGDHEVVEASGGKEGEMIALNDLGVNVMLCDVNMPDQDGITTLKNVTAERKDLPVIMVTTEGGEEKVTEMKSAGARTILVKPFEPDDLKNVLEGLI
jgi:two-component system chemotaxis response regulator CheY